MTRPDPSWKRIRLTDNSYPTWLLARYLAAPEHPSKLRVWKWLYTIAGRPEVCVRYAGTARMRLDLVDGVQNGIAANGFYEVEVWDTLAGYLTGADVVWDIGGHVGGVAIRAALDPRVKAVHCFEPNPHTAARLQTNLSLNPDLPITHHAVALGDKTETRTLHFGPPHNIGQTSFVVRTTELGTPVECETVDGLIATGSAAPPTLIKIDVEGFEPQVLIGASHLLASGQVKAIVFESAADPMGKLLSHEIRRLLEQFGYSFRHLVREDRHIDPNENFLATRNTAT